MNTLKKVLCKQGKTEKWLADKINVEEALIQDFCNGEKVPNMNQLFEIVRILNVKAYDFYPLER